MIKLAAMFYFIGLICFYHMADFTKQDWAQIYYLWDKCKDVFFSGVIYFCIPKKGKMFKTIFYFCLIRFIWELAAWMLNSNINNSRAIDFIFLIFLGIWIYQLILEWQRSK